MDKTASRIIMVKNDIDIFLDDISKEFLRVSKSGCDGNTGHSECKQRSLEVASDNDVFATFVHPLQLYSIKTSGDKNILWQNTRSSSVRYCRPITIEFKKERAELVKEETSVFEERIKKFENP
jgi:hypothetical protein